MVKFPGKVSDFDKIGLAAAGRGDVDVLREILKARPKWLHRIGPHGRTMIWEASHRGKLPMVKYLVRRKCDIESCGTYYTPYFVEVSCYAIARHKKHHEVADYLLARGAKQDIHTAAFLGDLKEVKKLLKRKPKLINAGHPEEEKNDDPDGPEYISVIQPWATPLCYALRFANVETVEFLIDSGATIKGLEERLFIAVRKDVEKIRLLLENGADPGKLPEILPDEGELYELAKSYGVKDKPADSAELVYLCRGDRGGNPDEVARLIKHGAKVNFQDHHGKTALHRAAKAGFVKAMQVLLDHGAKHDIGDKKGETALFEVVRSTIKNLDNRKKALRLLLKAGADPRHPNSREQTPLSVAESSKKPGAKELAKILKRA